MTDYIENKEQYAAKESVTQTMRESLSHEAFSDAIKNSKNQNVPTESNSEQHKNRVTDQLPNLSIDDHFSNKSERDVSDAAKESAKALLNEKDGVLDKLSADDRAKATEALQAIANDGIKGNTDAAKDGEFAKAADARDEFERLIDAANPKVIGALIGGIEGFMSGGPAGILPGAILGMVFGSQSGELAKELWRALPQSARNTILDVIRPVIRPFI